MTAEQKQQEAANQNTSNAFLELAPKLDIKAATTLKGELAMLLDGQGPVYLKATSVTRMSTAACQLIVAFVVALRSMNRVVRFIEPSPQFASAFALLGLTNFITEEP